MRELWVVSLGLRPYGEILELQRAAAAGRISGEIPQDVLLLVEHPPVVTLGRGARDPSHLTASRRCWPRVAWSSSRWSAAAT
jgi:lipoyl(octanoyl) transferase